MWLNKTANNVVFMDVRSNSELQKDWQQTNKPNHHKTTLPFKLTLNASFCQLPFQNNVFNHINFDPPHLLYLGKTSIFYKKYGALQADVWRHTLRSAFKELWRILQVGGTLNLKWSTRDVKLVELLKLFHTQPQYGQICSSGVRASTYWFCFVKFEEGVC
jgi:hypothetical protein